MLTAPTLAVLAVLLAIASAAPFTTPAVKPGSSLPGHRSIMTLLVEHSSQFPEYVNKIKDVDGAINVAAPICFNPGHIGPGENFTDPYCLNQFLTPMRAAAPDVSLHPMVQMANTVLKENMKTYGHTVAAFKQTATMYDTLIDGYLFYPQLAAKAGTTGDKKALMTLLNLWADEMHSINKTLGVFVPDYHSKFSPAAYLNDTRIDYWLTNLEVKSCTEVADFYWGLHGKQLDSKGGGALFTSDGAFNSAACMDQIFGTMNKTGATAIGFYSDFSSMGDVWWDPMRSWVNN